LNLFTKARNLRAWSFALHFSLAHRAIPADAEDTIANFIRINFVSVGRSLTRSTLRPLILMLVQDFIAQETFDRQALNFKCSPHFMLTFLRGVGLSFRRARQARIPEIDDSECARFLSQIVGAYHRDPPYHIVNFDESNWHLVRANDETVAEWWAKTVHQYVEGDPKANFTFLATVTAEGTKFPLILVAKGKTARCHKQLGVHPGHEYEIWRSSTGWCTAALMLQYFGWLRTRMAGEPICVEGQAAEYRIEIIWVPKGAAGQYQPLDRRTFGALKSQGNAKWKSLFSQRYGAQCTKEISADLLLQSSDELSVWAIAAGWDFGEDGEEDERDEPDSSDGEFEIRIDTDYSDPEMEKPDEAADDEEEVASGK
jgi:hypothetical protein